MKTIKKAIGIHAPKEKVWNVLLQDQFTRIWYAEFSEGSRAETDWSLGSKAIFTDGGKNGLVGKVIENQPQKVISVEYQGVLVDGTERYDTAEAQQMMGCRETYRIAEQDGVTQVSIESDMADEYFDSMAQAWDRALQKVKTLSETA